MKYKRKNIIIHLLLIIGLIFSLTPFAWMILTSFKTLAESIKVPMVIFPQEIQWVNYKKVCALLPFKSFYFNTIVSTAMKTIGQLVFCSMAGYAFARIKFPFKNFLFIVMLSILMVPIQLYLLPQYMIIQKLGLLDTVEALIIPGLFSAFGTFLMRQFFMSIPKEIEEAAIIDGCNPFQIFFKIFLPLSKAPLTALGVLTVLWGWNDLMWPLIINNSTNKMTLSAGIASLQGQFITDYPVLMAGAVLATLPMIIIFFLFQNKFIEGLSINSKL